MDCKLSNIFFGDDLITLFEAFTDKVNIIKDCTKVFCVILDQKVNIFMS